MQAGLGDIEKRIALDRDCSFDHISVETDSQEMESQFCLVQDILRFAGNGITILFSPWF